MIIMTNMVKISTGLKNMIKPMLLKENLINLLQSYKINKKTNQVQIKMNNKYKKNN